MRTRREGAVQDQTWVTSNPRERQGSRGPQSGLDRGATQRKSPSPASSSQWPALISRLSVVCRLSVCPFLSFLSGFGSGSLTLSFSSVSFPLAPLPSFTSS